jgi:hypothetical protein
LAQACERHGWNFFAYVLIRNHTHLALETPEPNLAAGMQWLQATFAVVAPVPAKTPEGSCS